VIEPMETHFKSQKSKKKSMALNLRFPHLISTATPFKHMNFSQNGNKWSFIESKNKIIAISTFIFGVLIKNK
jgi:hypothetical protein